MLKLLKPLAELQNDGLEFFLHRTVVFDLFVQARPNVLRIYADVAQLV